jgi:hypothetical protein
MVVDFSHAKGTSKLSSCMTLMPDMVLLLQTVQQVQRYGFTRYGGESFRSLTRKVENQHIYRKITQKILFVVTLQLF